MERRRRDDTKEVAQRVKADQRELDGRRLKGVRIEHPSWNQPFFASFGDHTKMAFSFRAFRTQDCALLSI
jgi:hypothetical protein